LCKVNGLKLRIFDQLARLRMDGKTLEIIDMAET